MATSPNSTILSRRTLMASAPAVALAAISISAKASTQSEDQSDGCVPADDMLPRHREAREVVLEIERWGHQVVFCGAGISIHYGGPHREPLELWARFNALDKKLLAEWLQLSGRIEGQVEWVQS